jgi:hypothetical protein
MVMVEMYLRGAHKVDCYEFFPPEIAVTAKLVVEVTPKDGAVLIHTSRTGDVPIRFNGPRSEGDVPCHGREIYAQLVNGATQFKITCLGWSEEI